MKVFADTNILLDLLSNREPFCREAAVLLTLADRKELVIGFSSLSAATVFYVLSKSLGAKKARKSLVRLSEIATPVGLSGEAVKMALHNTKFNDFEDALQHACAMEHGFDFIITRNLKDFQSSEIPAMSAGSFLALKRKPD